MNLFRFSVRFSRKVHPYHNNVLTATQKVKRAQLLQPRTSVLYSHSQPYYRCETLLATKLRCFLNKVFGHSESVFHGARKGPQPLRYQNNLSSHIGKAQDDGDRGAIAESDIRSFYDNISLILCVRWLQRHGCPAEIIGPICAYSFCQTSLYALATSVSPSQPGPRNDGYATSGRTWTYSY